MPGIFSPLKTMSDKIHEIRKSGNLFFLLNAFLGAYNRRTDMLAGAGGGDNSQVLTVINNLTNLVKEKFMGLKEDFGTLQGKFDTMETAVTAVAEDIGALKNELKEANDRANIDLTPLITRAENIEAGLRASVGAQPGSDPEAAPEPTPEPSPEG